MLADFAASCSNMNNIHALYVNGKKQDKMVSENSKMWTVLVSYADKPPILEFDFTGEDIWEMLGRDAPSDRRGRDVLLKCVNPKKGGESAPAGGELKRRGGVVVWSGDERRRRGPPTRLRTVASVARRRVLPYVKGGTGLGSSSSKKSEEVRALRKYNPAPAR
eukprot:905444-Pyramimonas_sp.AAC.1